MWRVLLALIALLPQSSVMPSFMLPRMPDLKLRRSHSHKGRSRADLILKYGMRQVEVC
jgi:hypothetical protein